MLKEILHIDSVETLSVISDPFRLEILTHLKEKPYSPHKLSKILGKSAQNVNYHFKLLLEAGIIYKKYEERKRGAFEAFYQAIATVIRIDNKLLNDQEHYQGLFKIFDNCEIEIVKQFNNHKSESVRLEEYKNKDELIKKIDDCPGNTRYVLMTISD